MFLLLSSFYIGCLSFLCIRDAVALPYSGGSDARDGVMLDATVPGLYSDVYFAAQSCVVSGNMAFHMTFDAIRVDGHSQLFGIVGADAPRYCASIDEHR